MEECHDQVNWTLTSNNRTMQELIAQMSKKQLTIEIHRLGADYPVKSDQKASKKAAIKLLRKLLKEEQAIKGISSAKQLTNIYDVQNDQIII